MSSLVATLIAAGVAIVAWTIAARSLRSAGTLAIVTVLAGIAVIGRVAVSGVPDVEPVTTIVTCVAVVLGVRPAAAIGIVAIMASNVVIGEGPWTFWQMAGFAAVAVVAAASSRALPQRLRTGRQALAVIAGLSALVYDLIASAAEETVATAQGVGSQAYLHILLVGLPFTVLHVAAVVTLTIIAGPPLVVALRRAHMRLPRRAPVCH